MTNTSILVRSNWINIFIACVFFATASCSKDLSLTDEYFIGSWDYHQEFLFQELPGDPFHLLFEHFCWMDFYADGKVAFQCDTFPINESYWYYRNNPREMAFSEHEEIWDHLVIWDITSMEKNGMIWERGRTNAMGKSLNLHRRTFTRK